jgi:redox-sensitive bicupin YhaK (pirin superfamily)
LFQLWLNLPSAKKMVAPDFTMFWAGDIPRVALADAQGLRCDIEVVAGDYAPVDVAAAGGQALVKALPPPPDSWASVPDADVAIWILRIAPGARMTLPAASAQARRALYLTTGDSLEVGGQRFDQRVMVEVRADQQAPLHNPGPEVIEVLVLQGRPIGEPVVARGPFVMNTQQELLQAMHDYQRTEFGGWPWPSRAHTHGTSGRFARHADGRTETPAA